ncbi:MAG: glycoside hydrolase family 57 [Candidatus Marinimicrobia bacterium]|nr:glycoside hydrolase family 57 [Candidatus Neomarinimicrobiota bacterium]
MSSFQLYSIFHLNIAYSSIEEEQWPEVIRCCYWPLLRLARKYDLPFGIEATGSTLETIAVSDPAWIAELQSLTTKGPCEFIGSGYAQVIGPLVPAEVNAANLRLGNVVYEKLLGLRPDIALVNEQAYSAGLVQHYIDAGYRAIAMEWDNPFRCHSEWNPEWRYLPQIACGQHGEDIPLIWNNAIAFQKFQRYAHGEMELDEYRKYLCGHLADRPRAFSLYSNDVEIFDFRPGRYHTEASLHEDGEWNRIDLLFEALLSDNRFSFIRPNQALDLLELPEAGNRLHLGSTEQPIPVKKQEKYNITRWVVTGRDDLSINTACWRIFESLKANSASNDDDWRELCYLWSSDFRTHITEKRWKAYLGRLHEFEKKVGANHLRPSLVSADISSPDISDSKMPPNVHVEQDKSYLTVETDAIKIRLNNRRGFAIDALWFKNISEEWLCGTLHHGYYDDINWGADYYTGHLVLESSGHRRITDLEPAEQVTVAYEQATESVRIQTEILLDCGKLYKTFRINGRKEQPYVNIDYQLDWSHTMAGSLRLGYITLNPEAFSQPNLFYATHNGGHDLEYFKMTEPINHGDAVSFLISAKQVLGCTGSVIKLGDRRHHLNVTVDKSASALVGMINYQKIGNSYICRLIWSAQEMDDTSKPSGETAEPLQCSFRICGARANTVTSQ